ncbi:hypothetical protein [Streptomyces sp. NPDC002587]
MRGVGGDDADGGPDWSDGSNLNEAEPAGAGGRGLVRGEGHAGLAVIALALKRPGRPAGALPVVAGALESPGRRCAGGVIAPAHVARLHRTVDRRSPEGLHPCPRGNEADDDLWSFVPHRELPLWSWRYHGGEWMARLLPARCRYRARDCGPRHG